MRAKKYIGVDYPMVTDRTPSKVRIRRRPS